MPGVEGIIPISYTTTQNRPFESKCCYSHYQLITAKQTPLWPHKESFSWEDKTQPLWLRLGLVVGSMKGKFDVLELRIPDAKHFKTSNSSRVQTAWFSLIDIQKRQDLYIKTYKTNLLPRNGPQHLRLFLCSDDCPFGCAPLVCPDCVSWSATCRL